MPRRLNAVMLKRQRALARRRPNPWLASDVDPSPRAEYAEMTMGDMDRWSPRWRALANFYGYEKVSVLKESGVDPMIAWGQLEAIRLRKQEEWLRTDYHPRRIVL